MTDSVMVPREEFEALSRADMSLTTACDARGWAILKLAAAPAPTAVGGEDAIILAMCKAHDAEESAAIGEPSPWREDFDHDPDWEQTRFLAMREAFDVCRAALQSAPAPSGEAVPVAWLTTLKDGAKLVTTNATTVADWVDCGRNVQPLYAAPSAGDDGLRRVLANAYEAGAQAVHEYWTANPGPAPNGDPEFGEAADNYAVQTLADLGGA